MSETHAALIAVLMYMIVGIIVEFNFQAHIEAERLARNVPLELIRQTQHSWVPLVLFWPVFIAALCFYVIVEKLISQYELMRSRYVARLVERKRKEMLEALTSSKNAPENVAASRLRNLSFVANSLMPLVREADDELVDLIRSSGVVPAAWHVVLVNHRSITSCITNVVSAICNVGKVADIPGRVIDTDNFLVPIRALVNFHDHPHLFHGENSSLLLPEKLERSRDFSCLTLKYVRSIERIIDNVGKGSEFRNALTVFTSQWANPRRVQLGLETCKMTLQTLRRKRRLFHDSLNDLSFADNQTWCGERSYIGANMFNGQWFANKKHMLPAIRRLEESMHGERSSRLLILCSELVTSALHALENGSPPVEEIRKSFNMFTVKQDQKTLRELIHTVREEQTSPTIGNVRGTRKIIEEFLSFVSWGMERSNASQQNFHSRDYEAMFSDGRIRCLELYNAMRRVDDDIRYMFRIEKELDEG